MLRRLRPAALGVAVLLLAGCFTGERPSLGEPINTGGVAGEPTGVEAVDRLLRPLEGTVAGPFTATYEITRKLGPESATAIVVRDGAVTSVTVGDVRFLTGTGDDATCSLSTEQCEPGVRNERISNLSVPSNFWLGAAARRLRVTAARSGGGATPYEATIAGLPVQCVEVPIGQGEEKYCVTPAGAIASYDTADTFVNLTAWSDSADAKLLSRPS